MLKSGNLYILKRFFVLHEFVFWCQNTVLGTAWCFAEAHQIRYLCESACAGVVTLASTQCRAAAKRRASRLDDHVSELNLNTACWGLGWGGLLQKSRRPSTFPCYPCARGQRLRIAQLSDLPC